MTISNSLPDGPKTPRLLRMLKFIFQPVKYLDDYSKIYGDAFAITGRNGIPLVYFSQPQALQAIFSADSTHLEAGRGNRGLEFLLGNNSLILLDGDRHQRQRQLLTPPFHGERMRAYGETIQEITQQVIQKWQIGKPFNIRQSMQELSLRVILRVVFGLEEGENLEKLRNLIISQLELSTSPLMSTTFFFPFWRKDLGAWSPWGKIMRQRQQIDSIIYALIAERRAKNNENRQDILSLMMSARDQK